MKRNGFSRGQIPPISKSKSKMHCVTYLFLREVSFQLLVPKNTKLRNSKNFFWMEYIYSGMMINLFNNLAKCRSLNISDLMHAVQDLKLGQYFFEFLWYETFLGLRPSSSSATMQLVHLKLERDIAQKCFTKPVKDRDDLRLSRWQTCQTVSWLPAVNINTYRRHWNVLREKSDKSINRRRNWWQWWWVTAEIILKGTFRAWFA